MIEWLTLDAPEPHSAEPLWNSGHCVDLVNCAPTNRDVRRSRMRRTPIRQGCSPNLLASAFDRAGPSLRTPTSLSAQRFLG